MEQKNSSWNELIRLLCECGDIDLEGTRAMLTEFRDSHRLAAGTNVQQLREDGTQADRYRKKKPI